MMPALKKKLGLEDLSLREKIEKGGAAAVVTVVATVGGWHVLTGDISYNPSDTLTNITSGLMGTSAAAATTPYEPKELDGVCSVAYDGEFELFIQGNDEGYRWTAVLPPEEFTFEGTYVDKEGTAQDCDYAFYQEQFEEREPQEVIANLFVVPEGGVPFAEGSFLWGEDRGIHSSSLDRFSGLAVRTPELTEGATLGDGVLFSGIAHNFECEDDTEVCVRWEAHITGSYDQEVILPPEERPLA